MFWDLLYIQCKLCNDLNHSKNQFENFCDVCVERCDKQIEASRALGMKVALISYYYFTSLLVIIKFSGRTKKFRLYTWPPSPSLFAALSERNSCNLRKIKILYPQSYLPVLQNLSRPNLQLSTNPQFFPTLQNPPLHH